MNKIVKSFALSLMMACLFSSCSEEVEVTKLDVLEGTFTGTLTAIKGDKPIYTQEGVELILSNPGGNYMDLEMAGAYEELNNLVLVTKIRLIALWNHEGTSYSSRARIWDYKGTPYVTPYVVKVIDGKVVLNITMPDVKPYTIIEFKEN